MSFDPRTLDPSGFNWGASQESAPPPEVLPTAPDMSSDEWDNPTAEPIEDIDAQLQDLAADSERNAVYLSPDQREQPKNNPPGSVVIEDFDGKGGTLIARNQAVADKAMKDQTAGVSLQKIIGELTLAGSGKPSNPDAIVVQKKTPDGAVQRESIQATPDEAKAVAEQWGEGVSFTDTTAAVQRRKQLVDVGGTSEALALEITRPGFRSATRESLDAVGMEMQDKNIGYLEQGPYAGLDFQAREDTVPAGAGGPSSPQDLDPEGFNWRGMSQPEASKDDYGWGIKYAFMRGLLRAGQLIDLAQGDVEEYAEGAESLMDWEVSEGDADRLAELQESEGFWQALGYYVTNPALAMQVVVESLPMSAAPLAGGLAGSVAGSAVAPVAGTIIGGMTGAGLGSYATEYLASIGDALQEHGVDATDPEALKAAFADEAFMATAREFASDRAIGVAAFDALSMGIAGRIFKPVKALTGAATKTGAVVGGTSEILAQAGAGALGERSGQIIAGQEYDPAAVAGEFIGEIVPGMGEIAINRMVGRDAGGNRPDVPPVAAAPGLGDPDAATPEGDVADVTEQEIPVTDVDIEAEAADQVVETPPPESETATTSPETIEETAPEVQGEPSPEVVEEVPVEEMLAEAAAKEEAAEQAAAETESPIIDTKKLGPKVTETITSNEKPGPVRSAWRGVMQALAKRYPETAAKVPQKTFTGTGVAKFFKALQEDVDLTKDLPELKAFLDEVTTGKPAEVIQALERLTGQVQSSTPSLTDAPIDSIAGQVQAEYNNFMAYYEGAKTKGKGKLTKGKDVLKGTKIKMANKLGELSGAVRALLNAAEEAGVLEAAGIGANYGKTMELADSIADSAQAPIEKKTKGGGKSRTIGYNASTLLEVATNLKEIAEKVTPLLAEAEAKGTAAKEKAGVKAKAAPTSPVTEAPAKPKKAEAAKKTSKAKAEKKAAPEKVSPEVKEGLAQQTAERTARIDAAVVVAETGDKDATADAAWDLGYDLDSAPINKLRKIAKALGAKTGGKKAVLLENITEAANNQRIDRQKRSQAAEDVEIRAEVEKHVPKKFRNKHVFHAVRNVKDIAAIVKNGLKKGTNLALDIMGQGVSMLGDVGTTVLVFKDDKGAYTTKGYQNDGVAKGGMKPVAIITDETDTKIIAKLGKTGLPVYSKGKRVAAKAAAAKVAKKPDVKGAKPDEVFDPEPLGVVGSEANVFAETVGVEKGQGALDRSLEKAGVSKAALKTLRGIQAAVDTETYDKIVSAAYEFMKKRDMERFWAQVSEATGGKVIPPHILETLTEFSLAIAERMDERAVATEDALDNTVDERLDMTEDERAIAEMTGAIEPVYDPEESVVDEWGVAYNKRYEDRANVNLNRMQRLGIKISKQVRLTMKRILRNDIVVLTEAMNKLAPQINEWMEDYEGNTGVAPPTMQTVLEALLTVLPANHRFTTLAKLLAKLNLQNEVRLTSNVFELSESGSVRGNFSTHEKTGFYDPENSVITVVNNELTGNPAEFIKTLLHEMVHAATVHRYNADRLFRGHMNELWRQALVAFKKAQPDFKLFDSMPGVLDDPLAFSQWAEENKKGVLEIAPEYVKNYMKSKGGEASISFYGLANPFEFIAESFTNPNFQSFLASIELDQNLALLAGRSSLVNNVLTAFLSGIQKMLGMSLRNTVLAEVLLTSQSRFNVQSEIEGYSTEVREMLRKQGVKPPARVKIHQEGEPIADKKVRSTVVNDTADAARQRDSKVKQTYESLVDTLRGLPRAVNLGFMNRDVIERNYRELFARAAKAAGHAFSPLTQYIKAKQAASQLAERFAVRATAALQRMQKLDAKTRNRIMALARDSTLAQVWPQVSLRDKMNAHLWSKPDKKGVSKLSTELGPAAKKARAEWVKLNKENPEAAKLLIDMAMLTKEIQDRKRIEALRTVGKTYELDASIIKQLGKLESHEDIMKMFPGMFDKEGNMVDADDTSVRPADTIIEKGDSKEVKAQKKEKLKEWRETRAVAKTAEEIVKGTSIKGPYFPLRRYGKYVVSSTEEHNEDGEPYVSFHHTRKEAQRVAAAIEKKHKIPTYVTKKIESMAIPRDVESVTAELTARMGKRKDGVSDHMAKRLQTAMLEIMADNTAYASQLKRHGVDGVAADDMGRAFEEYVFVAKYTLGDLATSYEVHQALKDLKALQSKGAQDILSQKAASENEVILIGDVVNELAAQNREDAKDREMSKFQKGVGLIGFFNFLGAPSYWVLNATQTLTVTIPYIGSKWGTKGTVAYAQSAGTIFKAMAAAIKSGDRSYEGFKSHLPPAAQKVVAALEAQGIIQSTIAHQFGDIMTPSTLTTIQEWAGPVGKTTATALKLMETIPEGVEKYNRISTALAIYNLSDGNIQAIADGVQATQFNYDSANRARLMKAAPGWAGGGLRAIITPMMMFKSYGIGLCRLLYGGMMDAAIKKGGRVEGMKLAGGLIVSHTVFGGVAGGVMMAPVQALVWAFNQAFREAGEEFDPDEAVELYLQDVANDTIAALVSRGVPAAAGVDMSKSINLGNLLWMGNDRINMSDAGGVETAITTALGPVAQWGITSVREGHRIWSGDPRGNWFDFAAAAIPLKMARGTIRGLKYEMEGIGTDTITFLEPEDVTGWIRSAMGFRPTSTAMLTDYEYNLMARDERRSRRKSQLVNRALRADTAAERAAVWDDIDSFNRSLERRGDYIRKGDVVRLRSQRRSRQRQYDRERR